MIDFLTFLEERTPRERKARSRQEGQLSESREIQIILRGLQLANLIDIPCLNIKLLCLCGQFERIQSVHCFVTSDKQCEVV